MKFLLTALVSLTTAFNLFAAVQFSGKPEVEEKIQVYPQATITNEKESYAVQLTGHGIREKGVVVTSVNVYEAASYVDQGVTLNADQPLDSLKNVKARLLKLTFMMDLSSNKLKNSFSEGLKKNNVDVNSDAIKEVFSKFENELKEGFKEGETLNLIGLEASGEQILILETAKGSYVVKGKEVVTDLWKIWFGNTGDDKYLTALKAKLSGAKP